MTWKKTIAICYYILTKTREKCRCLGKKSVKEIPQNDNTGFVMVVGLQNFVLVSSFLICIFI